MPDARLDGNAVSRKIFELLQALPEGAQGLFGFEIARRLNLSNSSVLPALKKLVRDGKIQAVDPPYYSSPTLRRKFILRPPDAQL
jgi:predicted transcriptional regulator